MIESEMWIEPNWLLADDGTKPMHCPSDEACHENERLRQIKQLKEIELIRNLEQAKNFAEN